MPTKKRTRRVSLPRPRRTSSRAELVIVMHPTELDALIERARTRSMSLTRYVEALLASDPDDVAPPFKLPPGAFALGELAKPDHRQLSLEPCARSPGCIVLGEKHAGPCRDDRGSQIQRDDRGVQGRHEGGQGLEGRAGLEGLEGADVGGPVRLSEAQDDGRACVRCGLEGFPMLPTGKRGSHGAQLFECERHGVADVFTGRACPSCGWNESRLPRRPEPFGL